MFFVRGLSFHHREVLINPDQVLYVGASRWRRQKTVLVLTHRKRVIVDQDTETVRLRFEEYLHGVLTHEHAHQHRVDGVFDGGSETLQ